MNCKNHRADCGHNLHFLGGSGGVELPTATCLSSTNSPVDTIPKISDEKWHSSPPDVIRIAAKAVVAFYGSL